MFTPKKNYKRQSFNDNSLLETQTALIKSLEKDLETVSVNNFHQLTSLNLPERSIPDKKSYASALLSQIEEKHKKIEKEKQEKLKEINTGGKLSLDFPTTPNELHRKRERDKKNKVKHDLESQIDNKVLKTNSEKSQKIENERREILELMKKFQEDEKEKNESLMKEKKMLLESWNSQMKFRDLQLQHGYLENRGFNPRSRSVFNKKEVVPVSPIEEIRKDEDREEIEEIKKKVEEEFRPMKKHSYLERVGLLKSDIEEKYKNSVQFRIKKVIEDVKASRRNKSNSLSPSRFMAKKKFDFRYC